MFAFAEGLIDEFNPITSYTMSQTNRNLFVAGDVALICLSIPAGGTIAPPAGMTTLTHQTASGVTQHIGYMVTTGPFPASAWTFPGVDRFIVSGVRIRDGELPVLIKHFTVADASSGIAISDPYLLAPNSQALMFVSGPGGAFTWIDSTVINWGIPTSSTSGGAFKQYLFSGSAGWACTPMPGSTLINWNESTAAAVTVLVVRPVGVPPCDEEPPPPIVTFIPQIHCWVVD